MAARRLAMNVIQQCAGKLEPSIKQFLLSLMSADSKPVNCQVQYHGVIYDLFCCAPHVLSGVLPYVTGELLVMLFVASASNLYFQSKRVNRLIAMINTFHCIFYFIRCYAF